MLTKRLLLLAIAVAACDAPRVSVADAAAEVPPFGALGDVYLGMTAREFARVRPAARPAAYTGYEEAVGGFAVAYRIPGSYSEDQEVSPRARVTSVSAVHAATGIEAGIVEWRRIVDTAGARLGSPPVCYGVSLESGVVGREAEWKREGTSFTVSLYESPATRAEAYKVGLGLRVAREDRKIGASPGRTAIDCNADWTTVSR